MSYVLPLREINKKDTMIAGGKGASLGEMINAGFPVPDGFVVLAAAFDFFLSKTKLVEEIDTILYAVNESTHIAEEASERIKSLILSQEIPKDITLEIIEQFKNLDIEKVAVRSSATLEDSANHAWAGQLESYLNVSESDVLEKVKHCWASLFTPRAIFYRIEKDLSDSKVSVAVVIQKMVNSEKSGIAFSVHPVTKDSNQMIIEAGFGLGEAIVSGAITPDSYVVEKESHRIVEINVSCKDRALYGKVTSGNEWIDLDDEKTKQQVLTEGQILKLGKIVLSIESHYGFPCDIEWAYEEDKFYIIQSRAITTLGSLLSKKILLEHYLSRDITLIFAEIISSIETRAQKSAAPYLVLERNNRLVDYFYNEATLNASSENIVSAEKNKENIRLVYKLAKPLKEIWEHPRALGKDDLRDYLNQFKVLYEKHAIVQFFDEEDRKLRAYLEQYTSGVNRIIRLSIEHAYPYHTRFADVVTFEEFIAGAFPDEVELQERLNHYIYFRNTIYLFCTEEFEINKGVVLMKEKPTDSDMELVGTCAFQGYAKGFVRIVRNHNDITNILKEKIKGIILVSPMTSVDCVSLFPQVSAIVTDEGGLTSHAGISAREFSIPAVVGTRFATQIFKNGDIVEVDADRGLARKFSPGKSFSKI